MITGKICLPTGKTKIVGVFGYPIKHSLSPAMHNSAFKHCNLDFIYIPFEVKPDNLKDAIKSLIALNINGINLTIPHKEACLPYLDEIKREAKLIGAVNTIEVIRPRKLGTPKLIGHNTDSLGFIRSLKEFNINLRDKTVLILGAGGAAKAVCFACVLNGIKEIYIVNRTLKKADILAENLKNKTNFKNIFSIPLEDTHLKNILEKTNLFVNATSVGMKKNDPLIVPVDYLNKKTIVYDLIYNPDRTKLLKFAKKKGCFTINGESMLVHQGALSYEIWTKKNAPVEVMRKALRKALNG